MSTASFDDSQREERDTFGYAFRVLRRRWPILLVTMFLCAALAVAQQQSKTDSYNASASVVFDLSDLSSAALQVNSGSADPARSAATNVLIARSTEVASAVARRLDLNVSPDSLLSSVSVAAAPNANVLDITASTTDPNLSARLANAFADEYIIFQRQSQLQGIESSVEELDSQIRALPDGSPERAALEESVQRLAQLRAVAGSNARVIGRATPPSSPAGMGRAMVAALGLIVGLALGLLIVFIVEAVDRHVRSLEEFERLYALPVLAALPPAAFRGRRAVARRNELEPYRIVRGALDLSPRRTDCVLFTSAVADEGKTTVAVDFAQTLALDGRRVVLLELDLRSPSFASHFDIDPRGGVVGVLAHHTPLDALLLEPLADLPELQLLPAGGPVGNPSELLGSPELDALIDELLDGETTVVIDAPPLIAVADTQLLLAHSAIDAVMVVARSQRTTREEIRRARAILERLAVHPIGLVVGGVKTPSYGGDARSRQQQPSGVRRRFGRSRAT